MWNLCVTGADPPKHLTTYENWQLNQQKLAWQKGFLDYTNATVSQTGTGRPIDGIIMPVAPWASCPHDMNDHVGYTSLLNLADRPCLTFPVTVVDPAKDGKQKLANAFDEVDQEYWDRYDPERWAGMPVNLQLVGKRLQDEEVLGLGHVLIEAGVTAPVA
jgi:amidase